MKQKMYRSMIMSFLFAFVFSLTAHADSKTMNRCLSKQESAEKAKELGTSSRDAIHADTLQKLKELRAQIRSWAPVCDDGTLTFHMCPFGDALEYMGMLCFTGDQKACDQVKNSQGPDGRWWRSPGLVGKEFEDGGPSFSNDMAKGAWAYIIATKDKDAAQRWMNYVEKNNYKLCSKSKYGFDSCATRAMFWTFAAQVYDYLGLKRTRKMNNFKFLLEKVYSPIEAWTEPAGYQMLLTGEMVFSIQQLEKRGAKIRNKKTFEKVARIIHHREPENPLYRYLVNGADQGTAEQILKYCPRERPSPPIVNGWPMYAVEFDHPMKEEHYKLGGGHYCIFMINLLTGSLN